MQIPQLMESITATAAEKSGIPDSTCHKYDPAALTSDQAVG